MSGLISSHNIGPKPESELLPDGELRWRREQGFWVGAIDGIDLIVVDRSRPGEFRWGVHPVDDRLIGSGSASTLDQAKDVARTAVIYARAGQRAYGKEGVRA